MAETDILTVAEVAKWLKCGRQHVINLAKSKQLSHFRDGNRWKFLRQHVEQYIERKVTRAA